MSKAKIEKTKKESRADFVTHSVAPLALSAVYAYYFDDDEFVEHDPLDAAAYEMWADEILDED